MRRLALAYTLTMLLCVVVGWATVISLTPALAMVIGRVVPAAWGGGIVSVIDGVD